MCVAQAAAARIAAASAASRAWRRRRRRETDGRTTDRRDCSNRRRRTALMSRRRSLGALRPSLLNILRRVDGQSGRMQYIRMCGPGACAGGTHVAAACSGVACGWLCLVRACVRAIACACTTHHVANTRAPHRTAPHLPPSISTGLPLSFNLFLSTHYRYYYYYYYYHYHHHHLFMFLLVLLLRDGDIGIVVV